MSEWGSNDWMMEQDAADFFDGDMDLSIANFNNSLGAGIDGDLGNWFSSVGSDNDNWSNALTSTTPAWGSNEYMNLQDQADFGEYGLSRLADARSAGLDGPMGDWTSIAKQDATGWDMSGAQDVISKLFSNPKLLEKGLGALFEMRSNKKRASALDPRKNLQYIMQNTPQDPAKQMRDTAIQQFDQAAMNPQSVPIIRDQLAAIQQAQDRKDAAAGRRSNTVGSAPQVLAAQGKVIQDYLNGMSRMYSPPNSAGLASMYGNQLSDYAKYNSINPAPAFSAMSSLRQEDMINELIKAQIEQLRNQ